MVCGQIRIRIPDARILHLQFPVFAVNWPLTIAAEFGRTAAGG